jgi:hypothetical protein
MLRNVLREVGMSEYISSEKIVGKRVRFKSTIDSCSILGFNDLGTVTAVAELTDWTGMRKISLWIRWDNGNIHPLIDGVDSFDIFEKGGI